MNRFLILLSLCALTLSNAQAQGGMGGAQKEEIFIPDVDKESFIYQIPSKWYPYQSKTDAKIATYIFPTGQEPSDWKEALQFDHFNSTAGVTDSKQVYQLKTQNTAKSCPSYTEKLMQEEAENGYSMVFWIERCEATDKSVYTLLNKAILGNEKLYIATKTWKYDPSESEMAKWEKYLRNTYVCDPTTDKNPCMPPHPPEGERPR
jgi:hypothetical protein